MNPLTNKSRRPAFAAGLALLALGAGGAANATPLGQGMTVVPSVDASASPGTLLAFTSGNYFESVAGNRISGTYSAAVFQNSSGFLDFYYQVAQDNTATNSLGRIGTANFGEFTTDVSFRFDDIDGAGTLFQAGTEEPETADRGVGANNSVGFNFFVNDVDPMGNTGKIDPGQASAILIIRTNATTFTAGSTAIINGVSDTVETFAPAAFVPPPPPPAEIPEPGTLALLSVGLLGMVGIARQRRSKSA